MSSSHIIINAQEFNVQSKLNQSTNADRCSNTLNKNIFQDKFVTGTTRSHSLNEKQNQNSASSDKTLDIIQLMGLDMPPLRRRGYARASNFSIRNGAQSAGSLPNLHQHIPVRGSSSNTSSPSTLQHHHSGAAELSLVGDDSSDSGVSSRSPTPNNNFLASAGAAGDQGQPDKHPLDKSIKEVKHVNNTTVCDNSSNTRVRNQHHQPYYPYQHYHNSPNQFQERNYNGHRNTYQNNDNNSNGASNNNTTNGGASVPKRRFHHSNRHCPPLQLSGRGRRVSGLLLPVPNSPSPASPSQPPFMNNGLSSSPFYPSHQTPPDRFLSKSHLVQVTKTPAQLTNGSHWDELSKAVWNKFLTNQQTEETYRKKLTLWKTLYLFIKMMFPRYGLFLVGSTLSGFGSNTSDVDMCLLVRRQEMDQRNEALMHLSNLVNHLQFLEFIEKIELVQAKVPILKFRERNDGIDVDLNCNNVVGIRNTHLLSCYSRLDWRVRPLVLVVKLWAQWHDINDAKNMTISSYSLALMVIHFLQCGVNPPVLPCLHGLYQTKFTPHSDVNSIDINEEIPFRSENTQPLGELLLRFFSYYNTFDYTTFAVSVRLARKIPIKECRRVRTIKNEPHHWKYLCIEEPFDQTNTARSVYDLEAFERIRSIINITYFSLNATHALDSIFRLEPPSYHMFRHHHMQVPYQQHQRHHNMHHQSPTTAWTNQPIQMQLQALHQTQSHTSQSSTSSQLQTKAEPHL